MKFLYSNFKQKIPMENMRDYFRLKIRNKWEYGRLKVNGLPRDNSPAWAILNPGSVGVKKNQNWVFKIPSARLRTIEVRLISPDCRRIASEIFWLIWTYCIDSCWKAYELQAGTQPFVSQSRLLIIRDAQVACRKKLHVVVQFEGFISLAI